MRSRNFSTSKTPPELLARKRAWLCGGTLLFLALQAGSADLFDVKVQREKKRYYLQSEAWFDASKDELYRVLTDYELFRKFTSAIVESNNIGPDEMGRPQFYTRMEGCLLFWCQSFVRQGYLVLTPNHDVVAITDPESSDFKYSQERWQLTEDGSGTRMVYSFEMEPDFWVPPLVGPYVIKRSLLRGGEDAVNRIEALAQGKEPEN